MKEKIENELDNLDDYDQAFVDLISQPGFSLDLNCVKIFSRPMRTGKDYSEVNFRIPYLLTNTPVRLLIATTPDNAIINDWENDMKNMCADHAWRFETDPEAIVEALEDGRKVVTYITNNKAFTSRSGIIRLYDYLDKNNLYDFSSFTCDEFHTWSLSCQENSLPVKGWSGDPRSVKNVMYKLMERVAAVSPYIFGKTATANKEVTGEILTGGTLRYKLINPLVEGEQKQYAHRVGHFGDVTYYDNTIGLFSPDLMSMKETWKLCLETEASLSKEVNVKRAILIPCADESKFIKKSDEDRQHADPTPEIFLSDFVKPNSKLIGDKDGVEIGFVLTCDESYSFDCNGSKVTDDISGKEILRRIKDITDPSILLVVKNMAGRGVSLPPVKAIFFAKHINRIVDSSAITEMIEQIFGRAKSVFIGALQNDFWTTYGGNLNNVPLSPRSVKVLNQYNLYMPDNATMKAAVENHVKYDACTWDMLEGPMKDQSDICPTCGCPSNGHCQNHENVEDIEKYITPTIDRGSVTDELKIEGS